MNAQRYILIIILTALIPAAILFVFNIFVDPYNEMGIRFVPQPLVETSRTEKSGLLQKIDKCPELIVFGSSRAMELDPKRFPISTFNFAVNSALPEDLLAQVLWLEQHNLMPRKALIMIDFYVFNGAVPTDSRLLSAWFLYHSIADIPEVRKLRDLTVSSEIINPFWTKYFSRKMLNDSWKAVKINIKGDRRKVGFMPNGLLVRVQDLAKRDKSGWRFDEQHKLASYTAEKYFNYGKLSEERVKILERTIKILKHHDVDIIFGLTPLHPVLQKYVQEEPTLSRLMMEVKSLLHEMGERYSAPFFDYSDILSFGCSSEQMWDLIHLMPECADKLVDDMNSSENLYTNNSL